jgi:hypothetical protein
MEATMTDTPNDYEVGYGKPPAASQFKPGKSGNPRGRPKGSRNIALMVEEELDKKIEVTIDGTRKRISKGKVVARRVVDGAVKGEPKAIATVMTIQSGQTRRGGGRAKDADTSLREATPEQDEAILAAYMERFKPTGAAQ